MACPRRMRRSGAATLLFRFLRSLAVSSLIVLHLSPLDLRIRQLPPTGRCCHMFARPASTETQSPIAKLKTSKGEVTGKAGHHKAIRERFS